MVILRTIFALVIAVSVALLPGAAAFKPTPMPMTAMSDMASAGAAEDCCPPDANPCKGIGDCGAMAGCALKCFSFSPAFASVIAFPLAHSSIVPPRVSPALLARAASPPFRPPRA